VSSKISQRKLPIHVDGNEEHQARIPCLPTWGTQSSPREYIILISNFFELLYFFKEKQQQPTRIQLQQKRTRMDVEEEGEEDEHEDSKEYKEEDSKEDGEDEDDVDEEEGPKQKPPKKITKNINGAKRNYYYQTTVKSIEELEEFRFKVMKKGRRLYWAVVIYNLMFFSRNRI
jgi:hypothetical protein